MRRLNRVEYNNTIRDLLGVKFRPADDFPSDDVGYGFDNIGDVLSLPTILMEKYLAAADKIVQAAIVTEESKKSPAKYFTGEKLDGPTKTYTNENGSRTLATNGELGTKFRFPKEGDYIFRIRAAANPAGDEPAKMELAPGRSRAACLPGQGRAGRPRNLPGPLPRQGRRTARGGGVHERLLRSRRRRRATGSQPVGRFAGDQGTGEPRPDGIARDAQADHLRRPSKPAEFETCAREILSKFASRAFRRPARADEVDRLVTLAVLTREQGDSFERGIQLAVQAVLVSPNFLFRVEIGPGPVSNGEPHYLSDYELASRLSYFLWSSMPDEELLTQAWRGGLRKRAVLAAQVRRMLADSKSEALVQNFAGQWLQTRNLSTIRPGRRQVSRFRRSPAQRDAAKTELFFAAILREDRSVLDFLDADFTFVNERLAQHYGIAGVSGQEFRRVKLTAHRRGGVITLSGMLAVTSNPTRTSPVKRGKWILENILGTPPPPPPPVVAELKEDAQRALGHVTAADGETSCRSELRSCHHADGPAGLRPGKLRRHRRLADQEGKFPIDSSGTLPGGQSFNGPDELKTILKGRKDDFTRCLAEKMLTYASGPRPGVS